jgi:hypothetical protein
MYKCNNCGNQSKKEHIKCPINSCGKVGTYLDIGELKKNYSIPKVSAKKKLEIETNKGGKSELDKWFEARRKEMIGVCANCGGVTNKNDDKYYRFNIAHILPKAKFKSVATHQLNFMELCFFGNSCHSLVDNKDGWGKTKCFDEVKRRFEIMLPLIADEELKYIPKEFY